MSDSYLVEEPDICDIDNKIIKDTFKEALFFINSLRSLSKK